jgi:hypothetical protein
MSEDLENLVFGVHDADVDDSTASQLWAESGAQWLTDSQVRVPGRLVRRALGLVGELDARGAGLAGLVAGSGLGFFAERAAVMGLPPAGQVSAGGATRLVKCADDWIALSLARADDLALLPAWLDGESDLAQQRLPDVWHHVDRATQYRSAGELVERATLLGLPCGRIGEIDDDRPAIAEPMGDATRGTLDGAVVVNLAALWAGPLAADVLARLGARLITVESTRRPDGGRLARRFFAGLHGRSESVAVDLSTRVGRTVLTQLLEQADVVIEGSRPRALEQMGIDARRLVPDGPRVWISITAFGRVGSARERVGFGDDTAAAGGLVGYVEAQPLLIADAVADPLTGLTAALAATEAIECGGRWLIDVALARVASAAKGGWIETSQGPSARPLPRTDPGRSMPLGRDNESVLRALLAPDTSP